MLSASSTFTVLLIILLCHWLTTRVRLSLGGSKKNTPYAAQMAAEDCAKVAYDLGLRKVKAYVKGPGNGRESAIRAIHGAGIEVMEIIDVTPLPHNGCRPPKRRRV